jgi:hypothetical protein
MRRGHERDLTTVEREGRTRSAAFWLYRWFSAIPPQQDGAATARTVEPVASGAVQIRARRPMPLAEFAEALRLAQAPARGSKPLLLFGDPPHVFSLISAGPGRADAGRTEQFWRSPLTRRDLGWTACQRRFWR